MSNPHSDGPINLTDPIPIVEDDDNNNSSEPDHPPPNEQLCLDDQEQEENTSNKKTIAAASINQEQNAIGPDEEIQVVTKDEFITTPKQDTNRTTAYTPLDSMQFGKSDVNQKLRAVIIALLVIDIIVIAIISSKADVKGIIRPVTIFLPDLHEQTSIELHGGRIMSFPIAGISLWSTIIAMVSKLFVMWRYNRYQRSVIDTTNQYRWGYLMTQHISACFQMILLYGINDATSALLLSFIIVLPYSIFVFIDHHPIKEKRDLSISGKIPFVLYIALICYLIYWVCVLTALIGSLAILHTVSIRAVCLGLINFVFATGVQVLFWCCYRHLGWFTDVFFSEIIAILIEHSWRYIALVFVLSIPD